MNGEATALAVRVSYARARSMPDSSASASASATDWLVAAMMMFTASFIAAPEPDGPRYSCRWLSSASTGRTRSNAAGEPPASAVSVPAAASAVLPETGTSRKLAPWRAASAASSRAARGPIVLMSMTTAPSRQPASTPPSPASTDCTAAASASMVITTSQAAASPAGDSASVAPAAASGAALAAVRFHTVSGAPLAARRSAIGRPMCPRPMKPIFIVRCSSCGAHCAGSLRGAGRDPGLAATRRGVQVRLAFPPGAEGAADGEVPLPGDQQFLGGEFGDDLAAIGGDDQFLLDPRRRP